MPQVQAGFLVVPVRLENLPQSEVLLPGALIRRLHFQAAPSQVYRIVQVLQREQDPREVQEHFRVVRGDGQRSSETLDRSPGVAFDPPEVPDLVVQRDGFRFFPFRSFQAAFEGVDVGLRAFLAVVAEDEADLGLGHVGVPVAVGDADEVVVVGEVDALAAVEDFVGGRVARVDQLVGELRDVLDSVSGKFTRILILWKIFN